MKIWKSGRRTMRSVQGGIKLAEKAVDPRESVGLNTKKSSNSWLEQLPFIDSARSTALHTIA